MHIDHFKEHFQTIIDQRQGAKVTYCLFEVLFGSLCAVIAGAKGWFDIREYIRGHHDWFNSFPRSCVGTEVMSNGPVT